MSIITDLVARLTADTKGFQDGMGAAESKTHSVAAGIANAAGKIAGAVAGAFAIGKAVDFAKESVSAASDLNETVSKVGVVFGKEAESVVAFGKKAASALGMSQNAALSAAGTYGNLFRSMGMAEKASAKMSTGIVQLAGDLASFNNLAPEDVLEKLRAGLTGETEPLKSLGVNISAAAVQAQAMKMGLAGVGKELSASAKAQATYALIMQQTSLAQGDFARTSDGLANQQRIFAANLENTKATLGTALLPVVNLVMNALNGLFSNPAVQAGIQAMVDGITQFSASLSQGFGPVGDILARVVALFQEGSALISTTVQTLTANIQAWWAENGASVMASVNLVWSNVQNMFTAGGEFVSTLVNKVLEVVRGFWQEHGSKVMAVVNWLWNTVQDIFNGAISIVTSIFQAFTSALNGDWDGFGQHMLEAWNTLWNTIKGVFESIWPTIQSLISSAVDAVVNFFTTTDWAAVGKGIIDGIAAGIKGAIGWLGDMARQAAQAALDAAKKFLGIKSPSKVFMEVGKNMMMGMAIGIDTNAGAPAAATTQASANTVTSVSGAASAGGASNNDLIVSLLQQLVNLSQQSEEKTARAMRDAMLLVTR
jgi:hypothetical protein